MRIGTEHSGYLLPQDDSVSMKFMNSIVLWFFLGYMFFKNALLMIIYGYVCICVRVSVEAASCLNFLKTSVATHAICHLVGLSKTFLCILRWGIKWKNLHIAHQRSSVDMFSWNVAPF